MTNEELLTLIKSCVNRADLLQKLGGYEDNRANRVTYILPIRKQLKLSVAKLNALFKRE